MQTNFKDKRCVGILSGGNSGEYEISVNSAKLIVENISKELYSPYLVILKGDKWVCDIDGEQIPVDLNDLSFFHNGKRIRFDVVFNIIHGTPGEDGMLQGFLDMMGVPYTSSGRLTSALTFNKYFCSRYVSIADCVNLTDVVLLKRGAGFSVDEILEVTGLPCFVKPNKGGSSVGMSKVKAADELEKAVAKAFEQDDEVLVEALIEGTEVTCGVFMMKGNLVVLPLTEIVPKTEYFDYEAKYLGASDEITPARVSEDIEVEVKRVSALLYRHLECKGVVRFDYIINKKGVFFLEVNTVPGMSKESIVPQQLREYGLSLEDFITTLIEESRVESL